MAGGSRIDLRLPPGLIESARAAQYANREALGARELDAEIKAKVRSRVEAAQRGGAIPNREGGQLEITPRRKAQRIWTRRRVLGTRITYIIQGERIFDANQESYFDRWTVYAEWDGYKRKIWLDLYSQSFGYSAFYISTFEDQGTGDELPPFLAMVAYNSPIYYASETWFFTTGFFVSSIAAFSVINPIPFNSFPDAVDMPARTGARNAWSPALVYGFNSIDLLATEYNPLHAWSRLEYDQPTAITGRPSDYLLPSEYDVSKIARAPNYVKTASAALTDEASYSVSVTVTP